jgi:5,10-methenyltetrahydromethanopterin hydrogenase
MTTKNEVRRTDKMKRDLYLHMAHDDKPVVHQGETVEEWLAKGNEIKKIVKKPLKRDKSGRYLKK